MKKLFISLLAALTSFTAMGQAPTPAKQKIKLPSVRVVPKGFDASKRDIENLLKSVTMELWKHFPDHKLEPIVVTRGKGGPIVLYKRNDRKEIVVRLDTRGTFWSQYSYQWAHEFCHILQGFREEPRQNKWFEETLAELASIYTLRAMSETWKTNPPYSNWTSYGVSLKKYADDVIKSREKVDLTTLAAYYKKHEPELIKNETLRPLNGAMAVAILPLFEKNPAHWESIRYMNISPSAKDLNFQGYLNKWYNDAPEKHRPFIKELSQHFGQKIERKN